MDSSRDLITLQGLGRNFLRHLRRTRVIVHIVDAAADDPVNDYKIVREVIPICFHHSQVAVLFLIFTMYLVHSCVLEAVTLASVVRY